MASVSCRVCGEPHDSEMRFCPRSNEPTAIWDGPCGTQVDRYYVERLLGGGGMGAVYRARHVHLDQPVALKLLKANLAASRDMVERFVREAKAAAAIGNPHIIRVSDFGVSTDGRAFLAMELLDGRDLDDLIHQEKTLAPARAARIALQVLDGLGAAHAAGIVHRDLKPANIFLLPGDHVKLVDFGVSKVQAAPGVSSLTQTGMVMGTPMYMAPEQFKGAREVDGRADLYAVGVTLYQMLSGALPYDAPTYESLILQIYTEPPKPLSQVAPSVPPALAAVVERGMAREPAQRFGTAKEFADALRATMAGIGDALPAAPPPGMPGGAITPFGPTAPLGKGSRAPAVTPAGPLPAATPLPAIGPPPVAALPPPPGKKKGRPLLWVFLGMVVAGGITAAAVVGSRRGSAPVAVATTETKPAEAKPAETKPAETKPAETKPAETKPAETKPAETKPAEAKPAEAKAVVKAEPDAGAKKGKNDKDDAEGKDDFVDKEIAAVEKEVDKQIKEALEPPKPPPPRADRPPPTQIEIEEPDSVGDLSTEPIREAAKKMLPKLEECRRSEPETVMAQFHVAFGKLGLAAPAAKNTGDPKAARCVANRIKEAGPRWKENENGIILLEVRLPAKK